MTQVTVAPQYPQRGQEVTVTYSPGKQWAGAKEVTLVFSYSNLYSLPWKIAMQKRGTDWFTSFTLPDYAVYATFYLQSGDLVQRPAADRHYAIAVYDKEGKRVEDGYLYESYSLSAQMGKDTRIPAMQKALLQKELKQYPDNYEARVRFIHNAMNAAKGKEKEALRQQALKVIADNFYQDPGNPGLMNKTTMGYLIIGEKTRLDSIRQVVKEKYPDTEAGYDLRIGDIRQIRDPELRKKAAEAMLQSVPPKDERYVPELHEILLEYYAEHKDASRVLYHLNKIPADTSPYRGKNWLDRARLLMENDILPDTALAYTMRAFAVAAHFPAGVIRYFPETGYILPYVAPEERKQVEQTAQGNSLSLGAMIWLKKGDTAQGWEMLTRALTYSRDPETLTNAGWFYRHSSAYEQAYQITRELVMEKEEDTAAQRLMKDDYLRWKGSLAGWEAERQRVEDHWKAGILATLKKERVHIKAPAIANLVTLDGKPVPASAMAGKIVVMDYWATWCVPCMKEMPYLQKVYDKYKDNPKVMFMVINSGSGNTLEDARNWSGNSTYSFPVYYTNDKMLGEKFGFNVIPATYIISPDGYIQFKNIGFEGPPIEFKLGASIDLLLGEEK